MAQLKYRDEQRLRQWDLMIVIGALIVGCFAALVQLLLNGEPSRNLLLILSLSILTLSGILYYLYHIRLIARYSEKSIKLSMMPVGTVKRKIKWEDVVESEIIETPRDSRWNEWNTQLASLDRVVTKHGSTCLHLKLKNNEEVLISCSNPEELKEFVDQIKNTK